MVFNATVNKISVISWWSVLLLEENGEKHIYNFEPEYVEYFFAIFCSSQTRHNLENNPT
jgi:hypothetical protein